MPRNTAYRPPDAPVEVAVGRVNIATTEAQVVSVGATENRIRPVVAVHRWIVQRAIVQVAGPHKPQRGSPQGIKTTSFIAHIARASYTVCNVIIIE